MSTTFAELKFKKLNCNKSLLMGQETKIEFNSVGF